VRRDRGDLRHAEQGEADERADDRQDRLRCARRIVVARRPPLARRHPRQDAQAPLAHHRCESAVREERAYRTEGERCILVCHGERRAGAGDARRGALGLQRPGGEGEGGEFRPQGVGIEADIEQRAERRRRADTGIRIEVECQGHLLPLDYPAILGRGVLMVRNVQAWTPALTGGVRVWGVHRLTVSRR